MSSEAKISFDLKRFAGIKRDYTSEEVERLKGSIKIEWADELRNMYGNKWLSDCADKLDPKLLPETKDQTFLS